MKKTIALCALIFSISSCTSLQYVALPDATIGSDNMATITVLRPSWFAFGVRFSILENAEHIGKLGASSYLSWSVDPAQQMSRITSIGENTSDLSVTLESGKNYYIKQQTKLGVAYARSGLVLMDENEALPIINGLRKPRVKIN
ncbi:MAG: hypothetical protein R2813_12945 [Flavobacteriales bacterium]